MFLYIHDKWVLIHESFFYLWMVCHFLWSAKNAIGTDPSATGEWSITCPLSTQAVPLVWSRCCVTLKSPPCLCICLVMIYYMSRLRMLNLQCVQWSLGRVLLEYNPLRNHSVPLHGLNYSLSEEESVIGGGIRSTSMQWRGLSRCTSHHSIEP